MALHDGAARTHRLNIYIYIYIYIYMHTHTHTHTHIVVGSYLWVPLLNLHVPTSVFNKYHFCNTLLLATNFRTKGCVTSIHTGVFASINWEQQSKYVTLNWKPAKTQTRTFLKYVCMCIIRRTKTDYISEVNIMCHQTATKLLLNLMFLWPCIIV